MEYQDLVDMMTSIDAKRLILVVHPDDKEKVQENVRQIGDEGLMRGQPILAPRIITHEVVTRGRVLVMAPEEERYGRKGSN